MNSLKLVLMLLIIAPLSLLAQNDTSKKMVERYLIISVLPVIDLRRKLLASH